MEPIKDIPKSALPIAKSIRTALKSLGAERRKEVLESAEAEFVDYRVDVYLNELKIGLQSGLREAGAYEIGVKEAMGDLINSND